MKLLISIVFGVFLYNFASATEYDFRCLVSVGLKNPIKLQFDFPMDDQKIGKVKYYKGSGDITIKKISERVIREVPNSRPSVFETVWEEETNDNSGGKYVVLVQGAHIYEFKYLRKKDNKIFKFEENLDLAGDDKCEWDSLSN